MCVKVVCEGLCAKVVCERVVCVTKLFVTKLCVKECVCDTVVRDKDGCERERSCM